MLKNNNNREIGLTFDNVKVITRLRYYQQHLELLIPSINRVKKHESERWANSNIGDYMLLTLIYTCVK